MSTWMPTELDNLQVDIINQHTPTNKWLIGYPGSGKSVVLAHLAKKYKVKQGKTVAIISYTLALGNLFKTGIRELGITEIPIFTPREFLRRANFYDYVICDEIQDLSKQTLTEIKNYCAHLICAGDANQSIYEKDTYGRPVMTEADAKVVLGVDPIEQNTIYRLTRSIVNAVIRFLPRMHSMREKTDYTKVDVKIACRKFLTDNEECSWIYSSASGYANQRDRVAILFSTHNSLINFTNKVLHSLNKQEWAIVVNEYGKPNFNSLNSYLKSNRVRMQCVLNGCGDLLNAQNCNDIILTTYHSAKGLDFEDVYIPFVCQGLYLAPDEERSKTLLMVAMTRSSKNLTFSFSGTLSEYISRIKDEEWTFIDMSQNIVNDDDDIF